MQYNVGRCMLVLTFLDDALRVIGDIDGEGVAVRDVFAQLVSSVLEGHRACLNLQKRDTRRLSVSDIIDAKRFSRGDPFRCELGETQAFAEFVRRAVEPDVDDGAVDVTVGGLAAQLRARSEPEGPDQPWWLKVEEVRLGPKHPVCCPVTIGPAGEDRV